MKYIRTNQVPKSLLATMRSRVTLGRLCRIEPRECVLGTNCGPVNFCILLKCKHKRIFSFNAEFICTRVFLKNLKLYLPKFRYFLKSTLVQINSKLNLKSIPILIICSYLTWGLQTCKKIDVQWHDFFVVKNQHKRENENSNAANRIKWTSN